MRIDLDDKIDKSDTRISLNPRLEAIKNSRDKKFKNFDLELKNVDDSLKDYKSMIKNQPLLFLGCDFVGDSYNLNEILRCYEKLICDDKDFSVKDIHKNNFLSSKGELFTNIFNFLNRQKNLFTGLAPVSEKDINEFLEITNGFCYLSFDNNFSEYERFVSSSDSEALLELGFFRRGFVKLIKEDKYINVCKKIKTDFQLTNEDLYNLFANTISCISLNNLYESCLNNNIILKFTKEFCHTPEDIQLLDNILCSKFNDYFCDNIKNTNPRESTRFTLERDETTDFIKVLYEANLKKTMMFPVREISILKYYREEYKNKNNIIHLRPETIYNSSSIEKYPKILSEIKSFLKTSFNMSDTEISNLITVSNTEFSLFHNYENLMLKFNQVFSDYKNNGCEISKLNDILFPESFLRLFVYTANDSELAFLGISMPYLLPYLLNGSKNKELFSDAFFDLGGSLESFAQADSGFIVGHFNG